MTNAQKERVIHLRASGYSCGKIAADVGVSENTVKSFCRRNSATSAQPVNPDMCANCGIPLVHIPEVKKKRFCSDNCRMAWWNAHPEAVNRKAVYYFVCPVCNRDFESYGNVHRKYCSRACFGLARRAADG